MKNKKETVDFIPPRQIFIGVDKAPVTLELFGDYESEATREANEVMNALLEQFDGSIKYVFRHFPLTRIHQKAHKASEAAIAAAQEGKFREMHELLFHNRHHLGVISLKQYAREAGVKSKSFLDDLINSTFGWFVQDDLKEGLNRGVSDVPALFINGEAYTKTISQKALAAYVKPFMKQPEKQRA